MIGITERGDAAIDYSWVRKLDSVDSTETYSPTAAFPAGCKYFRQFHRKRRYALC